MIKDKLTREDLLKHALIEMIEWDVKEFQDKVFLKGGLQDAINLSSTRGQSACIGSVTMMTYELAGRVMIRIVDDNAEIDLVTIDKHNWDLSLRDLRVPTIGINNLEGTYLDIHFMFSEIINNFNTALLKESKEVGIG